MTYTFTYLQDIATEGGADFESFEIGTESFLAAAQAFDWEYFMIDGDPYLGCANLRNGPSFQIDSIILKGIEE